MEQLPLKVRLPETARFATFVAGPGLEALEWLRRTGERAQRGWLWGKRGVGKTHLLQAACANVGEQGGAAAYIDPATLEGPALLEGLETLDLVCIDDLERIVGDAQWNAALFRLYTMMQDGRGSLVVASGVAPASLEFALPDLRSRLLAAAVFQLHELGDDDLVAALRLRAAHRGLELSDEAAHYLLLRLPRDMHSLCAVLEHLDEASLAAQRRLTVPFMRQVLESLAGKQ
jgi:DnaA family protein